MQKLYSLFFLHRNYIYKNKIGVFYGNKLCNFKNELIDFHMKYVTKTNFFKRRLIFLYLYFCLSFFLVFLANKQIYPIILAAIILFLTRKKFYKLGLWIKFKRTFNSEKYSSYFYPTNLIINQEYLALITDLNEKLYRWNLIKNVYLVDTYILIGIDSNYYILIPNNAFESLEDKKFFIDNIIKSTKLELKNNYPMDITF